MTWIVSTRDALWQERDLPAPADGPPDIVVRTDEPRQVVEGFGACFNELGWDALSALAEPDREDVLRELFAQFTICRLPIGANDFARDWYSHDEVPGDVALEHFSIARDLETLVPFIHAARRHRPGLRLWASPWSPPAWMKTNRHYAAGEMDESYLESYAEYFGRFIDEYRRQGIAIEMVMPQNEFNSAQVFPSCLWTPDGLARFIRQLGPRMHARDVAVFLGTAERADDTLVSRVLADPQAGRWIAGAGFQWAGKRAVAAIHREHPRLRIYQTEQECGDGRNDWRYCRYAWTQLRHYLSNGANAYMYWNIALTPGGRSTWGWPQNSLVTVDPATRQYVYNPEYYLLKHVTAFVPPGARVVETLSLNGFENQLAFVDADGRTVVVIQNDNAEDVTVTVQAEARRVTARLPADSFSTLVLPPG
ncbi:glycoside hydrolase family 30 beta sandwich domain-containing protein [Dactylosporangium sp. NPDC000244]|uniref:glycoside hydrolase family 30 protein n=1 Tax=Dactylosporangium sp. NPDC000244 TaxID=3154365 RepID=UPI0033335884